MPMAISIRIRFLARRLFPVTMVTPRPVHREYADEPHVQLRRTPSGAVVRRKIPGLAVDAAAWWAGGGRGGLGRGRGGPGVDRGGGDPGWAALWRRARGTGRYNLTFSVRRGIFEPHQPRPPMERLARRCSVNEPAAGGGPNEAPAGNRRIELQARFSF